MAAAATRFTGFTPQALTLLAGARRSARGRQRLRRSFALARRGLELADDGSALVRMPRGFEHFADHAIAPYLRGRSFVVRHELGDAELHSQVLVERIVSLAKDAKPL